MIHDWMRDVVSHIYTRLYLRNLFFFISNVCAIIANGAIWTLILLTLPALKGQEGGIVYLHYKVIVGVDQVGDWYLLFTLPISGLAIIVANSFLARHISAAHPRLIVSLGSVTCVSQLLLLFAAYLIIQVNIF